MEVQTPMPLGPNNRMTPLTLVSAGAAASDVQGEGGNPRESKERPRGSSIYEVDWSILMAHAQAGNRDAYRRLLEEITPYLRSLAARRQRDPRDIEDAVQDILLTVHAIRHTYDPTRPFGPWLVAIANRRIVDRLRHQGRARSRETVLNEEHETFSDPRANLHDEDSDKRILRQAVSRLPQGQRQAIELLKLREMSLKDAAAASGMSIASLKVATHRALLNLRKMLAHRKDET
jgi:RNA polymerase sigma-70 factor (ECF subfamily)